MARKVTEKERQILLSHPELVMFDPYPIWTKKPVLALSFLPLLLCPVSVGFIAASGLVNAHPHIAGFLMAMSMVFACFLLIIVYVRIDDWYYEKSQKTHYAEQLRRLLPEDLTCDIVHVKSVVREKSEGSYIKDGEEQMFAYSSMVNYIRIEPDTDLVEIYDGKGFWAMVRRDPETESLYEKEEA